jgi:hypothetical protein
MMAKLDMSMHDLAFSFHRDTILLLLAPVVSENPGRGMTLHGSGLPHASIIANAADFLHCECLASALERPRT